MIINKNESTNFLELTAKKFSEYSEITFLMNLVNNVEPNKVLVRKKDKELDITSFFFDNIPGENISEKFTYFSNQACNKNIELNSNTGIIMMITFSNIVSKTYPIESIVIMHDYSEKNTHIATKEDLLEVDKNNQKRINKKM